MIDKDKIIETVITKLKKLPLEHYLDLRTYKRNRSLVIIKKSEDDFLIIEDGYFKENKPKSPMSRQKTGLFKVY